MEPVLRPSSRRTGVGKQFKKGSVPGVLSLPEARQSNILNLRVENATAVFKGSESFVAGRAMRAKERCDLLLQAGGREGGDRTAVPERLGQVVCAAMAGLEIRLSPQAAGDCHLLALTAWRQGVYTVHI